MMRNLLTSTDFSGLAREVYGAAATLAKVYHSTIHLVHEVESLTPHHESPRLEARSASGHERLQKTLRDELNHPALQGVPVRPHLLLGRPGEHSLTDFARVEKMDLVIMAANARAKIRHLLPGGFTQKVIRHSPVPVLTYRRKAEENHQPPRTVLVPFDFSDKARAVFPTVRFLGRHYGSRVVLLSVLPEFEEFVHSDYVTVVEAVNRTERAHRERTMRLEAVCRNELPNIHVTARTCEGRPHREIVKEAERVHADLILMATHGWTGLQHMFVGSVAEEVVRRAPCSVMTVRPVKIQSDAAAA